MEIIDLDEPNEKRRLKALVYGKSGTGKTQFGASAPNALILLNERQAIPHIRAAQIRLNRKVYGILIMNSVQDYRDVLRALRGDKSKPFVVRAHDKDGTPKTDAKGDAIVLFERATWPDSVVLDSLTEACELIADEIREESPPKMGSDGLPVDSERYWNVFKDRASKLIRAFRDVDLNILYLCLLDDRLIGPDQGPKVRWVGPQMPMRSFPGIVQSCVNIVGVTSRKLGEDKDKNRISVYGISTQGPDYMELKPFPPLRRSEVTDFASWVERINGIDDGVPSPNLDAPEPEDEKVEDVKVDAATTKVDAPKTRPVKKIAPKTDELKAAPKAVETKPVDASPAVVTPTQTAPTAQEAQA